MKTNEKEFNEQESLTVILNMINSVKTGLSDNSFYFLLWGWLVFISSLSHYFLLVAGYEYADFVWLLMPVGGIVTWIYGSREEKRQPVKTYMDEFMMYVLTAFLACLLIVLISMPKLGINTYPMIMLLYGMWLYISGATIKFKPLIAGGIINWALAVGSMFVDLKMQLLFLAIAVLLGYIIPGHLLRNKHRQHV